MFKLSKNAKQIISKLKQRGHQAYVVGGSIRDLLLGLNVNEYDIATSALPQQVTKLFSKVVPIGIEYGTVLVLMGKEQFEVTTFRCDEEYVDGRHPSNVRFCKDLHTDLSRRDFTINALAYDPAKNELIDDFQGKQDLKKKLIRAIGDPIKRFSEDGLRPLRACRLAAKLNFKVEPKTLAAIPKTIKVFKKVAPERIHDELIKILAADKPSIAFELMRQAGLLKVVLPELLKCYKVKQPRKFHRYDVYYHNLYACDASPKDNLAVRLACLLHDIEKPSCKKGFTFYNHDQKGAKTAEKILRRLRFSNTIIKKVVNLISTHMFNFTDQWTDSAVRRFLARIGGIENAADVFALRIADNKTMVHAVPYSYLRKLQKRIDKIIQQQNALKIKDLKVSGHDVMKVLNIPSGPKVGQVLDALLEQVLDNPKLNERSKLIDCIKMFKI